MFGLIANPENRRASFFIEAVAASGLPEPIVVPWLEVLKDPETLNQLRACELVRIDSIGENTELMNALITLGGGPIDARPRFGELAYTKEIHRGFCELLDRVEKATLPTTSPVADIRDMFDKWLSHKRLSVGDVPRPPTHHLELASRDELRDFMRGEKLHRVFLKPLHGSSASGVCAYRTQGDRELLVAPIELQERAGDVRLFNSLRIRGYTEARDINLILERLLPDGMVCETWLRKAWVGGMACDLRIVTIAGEARQSVVRKSRHAMTNLHLGNERGTLEEFVAEHGQDKLDACRAAAESAAACFPDSLVIGVDVALTQRGEVVVLEVNAFGDLLPRILDQGESTYEAAVRAMRRG